MATKSSDAFHARLPTDGPFNMFVTVRMLQRRPANRVDHWESGGYVRAFGTSSGVRLAVVTDRGRTEAPDVRLEIQGGEVTGEAAEELIQTVRWILGLDASPAPTAWLAEAEPKFKRVTDALCGFRTPCFPSLFETCARVIPFQQLSLDAGTAIAGRLVDQCGSVVEIAGTQWRAFPSPEAVVGTDDESLRETGLSRAKVRALRALAELALDGHLDRDRFGSLSSDEAMRTLTALPGIGPWSAGVIMLRGLRRMDVFPTGDVGAARNLPALLGLADKWSPDDASTYAEQFGDRRGYLYFLGLGAQLLARGLVDDTTPERGRPRS